MVQNKFDVSLIIKSVIANPKVKNKALYELSNAITDNQKTSVRKKKARLIKSTKGTPDKYTFSKEKLSSEDLERRLINALNSQPNNANLLGKAIDFYIKVKGKESEMEEQIDITELLTNGIVKKFNS